MKKYLKLTNKKIYARKKIRKRKKKGRYRRKKI